MRDGNNNSTDVHEDESGEPTAWSWLTLALLALILFIMVFGVVYGSDAAAAYVPYILVGLASAGVAAILGLGTGFLRVASDQHHADGAGVHTSKPVSIAKCIDDLIEPCSVTDEQGRVIYANAAYRQLAGSEAHQPIVSVSDLFSVTANGAELTGRILRALDAGKPAREEIILDVQSTHFSNAPALNHIAYRISAYPLPEKHRPAYAFWSVTDITREKQRDEGIFEELRAAIDTLDHAPIGFFANDANGKITFANATLISWLGLDVVKVFSGEYTVEHLISGNGAALLSASYPKGAVHTETLDVDMTGADSLRIPVRLLHKVATSADGVRGESRTVVIDRRIGADVVDDARHAELRFARFFNNAPIAVATLDDMGHISRHNATFARMVSSLKRANFTTEHKLWMLVQDKDRIALQNLIQQVRRGEAHAEPLELALIGEESRFARFFVAPVGADQNDAEAAIVYIIETTEQKALELQFAQGQKMQAIGQLAGGIAHDFNNVLTAIIGFSDLLLTNHRPTDPSFQDIMNIKNNANRAAGLVRQLLAFSRKQTLRPEVLNLSDELSDYKVTLGRLLGEKINFKISHGRDLWPVLADAGQFNQVVMNLAVNARDAMPQGGKLTIRTQNIKAHDQEVLAHRGMVDADYVLVEVADSGSGIAPEIIDKIFEPFFSTKEVGKGTGLGLSTVYGIVKQTGGFIYCESEIGVGTTFKIYLPRHVPVQVPVESQPEAIAAPVVPAPARDLTGQGKILLVEDEDPVRAFAERALASRGYTVLAAGTGSEAIEFMKAHLSEIELIVSDVVMPEMDGPTLLKELLKLKPNVKVIFMSGYAEEAFSKSLDPAVVFSFLPKPFTLKQLAETVKTTLES